MNRRFIDYYLILEVHYMASKDVIKAAYKKLAHKHHPDRGGHKNHFHMIQEAYEVLSDDVKRRQYLMEWLKVNGQVSFDDHLESRYYKSSFEPMKKVLIDYLDAIRDERYESAYEMLSLDNRKRIFLKDFVQWQKLINEIHKLLEYDCVLDNFYNESMEKKAIMKVKVKEYNQLLHRVETDYFFRELIYDTGWKVHLKNFDIRSTIRKYKKILALNNKMVKQLPKLMIQMDENHATKFVSKKYFINNCEYEWLRYTRYDRYFSLISILAEDDMLFNKLSNLLYDETRQLDTYCIYRRNQYYLLLPETTKDNGLLVIKKLTHTLSTEEKKGLKFKISMPQSNYKNIKEMLDRLK
ncbi:MAG: DnaJ domain-containing protein [Clostridia bacterium]|nr:DnaJ domain-containing protein [Clostridia bacterium]